MNEKILFYFFLLFSHSSGNQTVLLDVGHVNLDQPRRDLVTGHCDFR